MPNEIVEMIADKVVLKENPGVYISGGLDSTIVLYHLSKLTSNIKTYTAKFDLVGDECDKARKVADYYNTDHVEVKVENFIERLQEILDIFEKPRYNVWPYFLAEKAKEDGIENVYIGEGSDEHFGGYQNKGYLDAWVDHQVYVMPTYEVIHKTFGINLEVPFHQLNWEETKKWHSSPNKKLLVEAYRGLIPDNFLDTKKTPPAFSHYMQLWKSNISKFFPNIHPKCDADVRDILDYIATWNWSLNRYFIIKEKMNKSEEKVNGRRYKNI